MVTALIIAVLASNLYKTFLAAHQTYLRQLHGCLLHNKLPFQHQVINVLLLLDFKVFFEYST